ncbi:unnamed protein product [Symbiodinium pilosum]|uniref:Uncharacterized protein n=1 Tax=Symbiodinium pilosum TaxID=2952 RepID=A0A812VUS6_SYMPI|nr:unnamed protein product [Symbiodinium pilosum]
MFSAKLGEDAEQIGLGFISRWMPGGGHPKGHLICNSSLGATSLLHCILPYFFWNVPLAATFILQHSVLRKALQRSFGSWGRRIYSFTSAVALHLFMRNYQDLDVSGLSLDLSSLGISNYRHCLASTAVILVSFAYFVGHERGSWFKTILLGERDAKTKACPVNMDVVTGMGICVYRELGWVGFLLFSGLSSIPCRITLGDVIMRLCAGIYMRTMSVHFQHFAHHYRGHWSARAFITAAAAAATAGQGFWKSMQFWQLLCLALGTTVMLVLFDVDRLDFRAPKGLGR